MSDAIEATWIRGNRAAWHRIMSLAAGELSGPEKKLAAALAELEATRVALRAVCEEQGDNEWDDDLHLADVVEKHLGRYLDARDE